MLVLRGLFAMLNSNASFEEMVEYLVNTIGIASTVKGEYEVMVLYGSSRDSVWSVSYIHKICEELDMPDFYLFSLLKSSIIGISDATPKKLIEVLQPKEKKVILTMLANSISIIKNKNNDKEEVLREIAENMVIVIKNEYENNIAFRESIINSGLTITDDKDRSNDIIIKQLTNNGEVKFSIYRTDGMELILHLKTKRSYKDSLESYFILYEVTESGDEIWVGEFTDEDSLRKLVNKFLENKLIYLSNKK